ncbi:hypothetical protein ACO0QE_000306 [Hanseniaspora vineae]
MSAKTYKAKAEGDQMTVYQDCLTTFNESPINPKKCRKLLTRLYKILVTKGLTTFNTMECTSLFFSISKLFQHQNNDSLRQMVYLVIKELSSVSEDTLMATASIMKDVQNVDSIIKPNAVRTLTRVLDSSTAFSAERLLKSCTISKDPSIASASIVSSYHLLPIADQTIKRLSNETTENIEALKSFVNYHPSGCEVPVFYPQSKYMSQYHALGVAYQLKKNDKIGLMKLVHQYDPSVLKNQFALVEWCKLIGHLIERDPSLIEENESYSGRDTNSSSDNENEYIKFLRWGCYKKIEAVQLEVCKIVLKLRIVKLVDLVFQTLSSFLSVPRTSTRFAAIKILNQYAAVYPGNLKASINGDLETLINDSNKNISTYAITTLLRSGDASNIQSLINNIQINDVSDDFKIIIIDSLKSLVCKFPETISKFLVDLLKNNDGSVIFKTKIVDCLVDLLQNQENLGTTKTEILENLCDFIEDCEYTEVLVRILYVLGEYGPKLDSENSSLYVRHIYNRVNLENSIVRSAAVIALSKFPVYTKNLLETIKANDIDDEVRDRAAIVLSRASTSTSAALSPAIKKKSHQQLSRDIRVLESKLNIYIQNGDFSTFELPAISEPVDAGNADVDMISGGSAGSVHGSHEPSSQTASTNDEEYKEIIDTIYSKYGGASVLGKLVSISPLQELTDSSSEFIIYAQKYLFQQDSSEKTTVFNFKVENTLDFAVQNLKIGATDDVQISDLEPNERTDIFVSEQELQDEYVLRFIADGFEEIFEFNSL